jgi:small subunit ribosomal protein S17e
VKRAARQLIEKYYARLTFDFDINKKVCDEVALIPSKRLRNKIAGFVTHLMKRIRRGPVRGISLKLQEEERERRLDYVPDRSVLDQDKIEVDPDTANMLKSINFPEVSGVDTNESLQYQFLHNNRPRRPRRDNKDKK